MCTVVFWPDARNPREILLPPSSSVIRAPSSLPESRRAELWASSGDRLKNKIQDHRDDNGGDDGVAKTRIAQ